MCAWPLCVPVCVHKVKPSWWRAVRLWASPTGKGGCVNFAWFETGVWENLFSEALTAPANVQTEWGWRRSRNVAGKMGALVPSRWGCVWGGTVAVL